MNNHLIWVLGGITILLGLGLQWFFWTGSDLPELSSFGRKITFIRRTFANVLLVSVGLVLFAVPAAQDTRWQAIALCAIIGFLVVVFVLAAWDLISMRWALVRDRDRTYHRKLKAEMDRLQAERAAERAAESSAVGDSNE